MHAVASTHVGAAASGQNNRETRRSASPRAARVSLERELLTPSIDSLDQRAVARLTRPTASGGAHCPTASAMFPALTAFRLVPGRTPLIRRLFILDAVRTCSRWRMHYLGATCHDGNRDNDYDKNAKRYEFSCLHCCLRIWNDALRTHDDSLG